MSADELAECRRMAAVVRRRLAEDRDRIARLALTYARRDAEPAEFEELARLLDAIDALDDRTDAAGL